MKTTAHAALRLACIAAAQARRPDIQFQPQTVGTFRSLKGERILRVNGGGSHSEEKQSRLDEALILDGGGYAEVEWKASGDKLRPGQIARIRNLVERRIPCVVVMMLTMLTTLTRADELPKIYDIDQAQLAEQFAIWCEHLPRFMGRT